MQDEEAAGGNERRGEEEVENLTSQKGEKPEGACGSCSCEEKGTRVDFDVPGPGPVLTIVISQPEEKEKGEDKAAAAKKGFLPRSESYHELCRVCQQQTEEALVDLGCRCRGELAKSHRSCIDIWFRTRGSNKCEICQHVAVNIPPPASLPSDMAIFTIKLPDLEKKLTNYWVWRIDSASGGSSIRQGEHGCFSPLWVAFSILIGGLLLDVLISVSLGVSALPVNIIIGVLIVLGLGTAFRLALECCHEWSRRRNFRLSQTTVNTANPGYPLTV